MNSIRKTDDADHRLIRQFKEGSKEAIEKIVAKYEEAIFNFGLKMCGQTQDAEDITQDTFLNAFKSLHGFREEAKLKNWLFRIAANACFRKRRKKKCEPDRELSLESLIPGDGGHEKYEIPDWSTDPSKALLRSEIRETIDAAVKALPPKYRMVFNLRDIEGFNTEETAEIMDISVQSVKTRLHRARFFLRKSISEHFKGGLPHA
jgi:RNA polymerase sigma-70 factor (ECF subfamily)